MADPNANWIADGTRLLCAPGRHHRDVLIDALRLT
jgi:hypothetical protein